MIEEQKKKYEEDLKQAINQWESWGVKIRHLEGAVMACEELLKLKTEDHVDTV
jgi:hypothetical protein